MTTAMQAAKPDTRSEHPGSAQYLTFVCAGEEYAVDILRVQEIKGWTGVTRVPHSPDYLLGVMNLRGIIVPVLDLRTRFGLERRAFDASTVVIVVAVDGPQGHRTVGIVVDAVSEVYSLPADAVRPPPDVGTAISDNCLSGLAMVDAKMIMILDVDLLVGSLGAAADSPDAAGPLATH